MTKNDNLYLQKFPNGQNSVTQLKHLVLLYILLRKFFVMSLLNCKLSEGRNLAQLVYCYLWHLPHLMAAAK